RLRPRLDVVLQDLSRLGTNRRVFGLEVRQDVQEVPVPSSKIVAGYDQRVRDGVRSKSDFFGGRELGLPHAGEIGFAVARSRRLRRQVHFAVRQTRYSRRWIVQPLREQHPGEHDLLEHAETLQQTVPRIRGPNRWKHRSSRQGSALSLRRQPAYDRGYHFISTFLVIMLLG